MDKHKLRCNRCTQEPPEAWYVTYDKGGERLRVKCCENYEFEIPYIKGLRLETRPTIKQLKRKKAEELKKKYNSVLDNQISLF